MISGAIVVIFAVGLTNDLSEPWIGLHDWNGAFYSQLARNLLRYPVEVHHGMGVVAMGEGIPPPAERSLYATHPPGVVWLVAGAFEIGGQSEGVARCVPIAFSIGTILLLMQVVRRRYGLAIALLSGLIYTLMPMAIYFGRMVDQEPPCLFFMLAAVACWDSVNDPRRGILATIGWMVSILAMVWIDWAGVLFAGFFFLYGFENPGARRTRLGWAWILAMVFGMLCYLVYAGLEGRWSDLWAIFTSRRGEAPEGAATLGQQTLANLGWGILAIGLLGLIIAMRDPRELISFIARGDPLNVLAATGIVWLLLFLRQYRIHEYWLYYLGPHIALMAAYGVVSLARFVRPPRLGAIIATLAMIWLMVSGIRGTAAYFRRITCKPQDVNTWKEINLATGPFDRVTLPFNPITEERHGGYVFHNVVSAQLAYYMDRPVTVRELH
jgi:4-amino-4-deoxy-L-arabinose transferase-like glycosyltransferase